MYEDEPLKDYYTLMDIAYIYTWRRVRDLFFWQDRLDFRSVYPRVRCRKSQMFLFAHLCKECMKVLIILNHLHCQIFAIIRSLAGIYIYTPCDL